MGAFIETEHDKENEVFGDLILQNTKEAMARDNVVFLCKKTGTLQKRFTEETIQRPSFSDQT